MTEIYCILSCIRIFVISSIFSDTILLTQDDNTVYPGDKLFDKLIENMTIKDKKLKEKGQDGKEVKKSKKCPKGPKDPKDPKDPKGPKGPKATSGGKTKRPKKSKSSVSGIIEPLKQVLKCITHPIKDISSQEYSTIEKLNQLITIVNPLLAFYLKTSDHNIIPYINDTNKRTLFSLLNKYSIKGTLLRYGILGQIYLKYLNWNKWLWSTSAKDISQIYLYIGIIGGIIGLFLSFLMRVQLGAPGNILMNDGQIYNVIVTSHGLTMIFYMVMPLLLGYFGNLLLPILIGSPDMSYPRLNNLSLWTIIVGLYLIGLSGNVDSGSGLGWTLYPPLSVTGETSGTVDVLIFSLHIAGISSLVGGINFIATSNNMLSRGMGMYTIALFIWSVGITALLLIISLPVLAAGLTMILTDRNINSTFFEPGGGGDPILYQHLF